jgi:hypothetical protein
MRRYAKPVAAAVAMVLAGASGAAVAEDAPAIPKLSDILTASGITATGYVAASYYHSTELNSFHQFDVEHNTFQLDQAAFTLAYQPTEGFGALVNVIGGEDARILNGGQSFDLTQAYVQYAVGGLTVIGGKYVTLAGAEVIAPTGNTNFSRGLLFFEEPLTHTGVRATYKVNDLFSFTAGVNNGWNANSESSPNKTVELGFSITPVPIFSLAAAAYFGHEPQVFGIDAKHTLIDLVATIKPFDALSFVINYDYHKQDIPGADSVKYQGIAGYVNYAFTDQFRISVRGEVLDDKDGFLTGTDQKIKEATVTLGYAPVKSFELRLEARKDKSGDPLFTKLHPAFEGDAADKQTEFAVQGVYSF